MADVLSGMTNEPETAARALGRSSAFADAERHSQRVRRLRRLIVVFSVAVVVGVVGYAALDPFRPSAGPFSAEKMGVEGTRVTMDSPRMNGYRKDGRPYDVRASKGVQDIRKASLIDLVDVDAKITMVDGSTAKITSLNGLYDSQHETMRLSGNVRIRNLPAYDMRLRTADINFKTGELVSNEPADVVMQDGTIVSDKVEMGDNGHRVTFIGNVKTHMEPADAAAKPAKGQKP